MAPITITEEILAASLTLDRLQVRRFNLDIYGQCQEKHDGAGDVLNCQKEHSSASFLDERLFRARLEFLAWVDMSETLAVLRRGANPWDVEASTSAYQEGLRHALLRNLLVFSPEFIH